ncbi:TetR/AcrR family transcriptional regulator [Leeia sp. TBRC 13508]|uniref:TetR/AcrR family transcriptional regulator n=1 Tax=Leeia speluncae TaxID=2884804 RepID=A0ABS8D6N0_9NEIS|nr:TetR/AcrR family transcriptional regulator [Leeia speluncae]MCB6183854.1 TetR/AcrR family transcriptional regulator [Leeia speluncae]
MDQPTQRNSRRKEARPGEILDAALAIFGEKGYAAASIEDIAKRAGVTKGTPYLYFKNKEDLFKALIIASISPTVDGLTEYLKEAQSLPVALQLQGTLHFWKTNVLDTSRSIILKLMMAEASNFPEVARFYQSEVIEKITDQLAALITLGIERGEFRPINVESITHALLAPMIYAVLQKHCFQCHQHPAPEDWLPDSVQVLIRGLLIQPTINTNLPPQHC